MKVSERLVARLRRELPALGIPEGTTLHRTYAEATPDEAPLSWFALGPDGTDLRLGSRIPMGRLLREPVIVAGPEPYSSSFDPHTEIRTPEGVSTPRRAGGPGRSSHLQSGPRPPTTLMEEQPCSTKSTTS